MVIKNSLFTLLVSTSFLFSCGNKGHSAARADGLTGLAACKAYENETLLMNDITRNEMLTFISGKLGITVDSNSEIRISKNEKTKNLVSQTPNKTKDYKACGVFKSERDGGVMIVYTKNEADIQKFSKLPKNIEFYGENFHALLYKD